MTTSSPVARNRKLPARYSAIIMPLILSVVMTFVVSAIATLRNVGFVPDFAALWMSAWAVSWLVAFPVLLIVLPLVRRVVALIVHSPETA